MCLPCMSSTQGAGMCMLRILMDTKDAGFVYTDFDASEFPGYTWKKVLSGSLRLRDEIILPVFMQPYQVRFRRSV